jgi:hypothetical protein
VFGVKGWFMQARRGEEKSLPKRALKARIKAVFASMMTLLSDCSIAE